MDFFPLLHLETYAMQWGHGGFRDIHPLSSDLKRSAPRTSANATLCCLFDL